MISIQAENSSSSLLMIVDADKKIRLSSGGKRIGEEWDPEGIVSEVLEEPEEEELMLSTAISTAEFKSLGGIEYRDGSWALKARQSLSQTGHAYGLVQYVVVPIMNDSRCLGVVLSMTLVDGSLSMIQELMDMYDGGFVGIYMKENGTVFPIAHALLLDSVNLNWLIPQNKIEQVASSILADSTPDLEAQFTSHSSDEFANYLIASMRMPGWKRDEGTLSDHRSNVFVVRATSLSALDNEYNVNVALSTGMMTGFIIFAAIGMFVAVRNFVDPLELLILHVKKGRIDKYEEILPRIMSKNRFVVEVGVFVLIATGFLIAQVCVNANKMQALVYALTDSEEQIKGAEFSYLSKVQRLVSYCFPFNSGTH
jgi:hypothetical protein